ncbi:hypothetical protein [Mycolicibacterium mucogenicum]|uniref:hypothetical protein n=1 Tax=Mycolicibacterium mucogenicum TaxID=56689 RepID=UPI001041E703|nr:hypothetical protein [Mycolicibacterium mucogenicum]
MVDVVIEHLYRCPHEVSTRLEKLFARTFNISGQIGFDLQIGGQNHMRSHIAAICMELSGNSQNLTELPHRWKQFIGHSVNNDCGASGKFHFREAWRCCPFPERRGPGETPDA